MSNLQVFKSEKNGNWYFRIVAKNGEIVAQSEGYTTKQSAIKGLSAVYRAFFSASLPNYAFKVGVDGTTEEHKL